MKFFAQLCPAGLIGQQPAARLRWFHVVTLTATLREQHAEASKIDAATCLRRGFGRQVAANLPARRSSEGGKELGYGG